MIDSLMHGIGLVAAILYLAIGGALVASAAIVWLSNKLRGDAIRE